MLYLKDCCYRYSALASWGIFVMPSEQTWRGLVAAVLNLNIVALVILTVSIIVLTERIVICDNFFSKNTILSDRQKQLVQFYIHHQEPVLKSFLLM